MIRLHTLLSVLVSLLIVNTAAYGQDGMWNGVFVGLNAGGGVLDGKIRDNGPDAFDNIAPDFTLGLSGDGAIVGGQVGYNHQFDNIVIGIEADINWSNIRDHVDVASTAFGGDASTIARADWDWFSTIRGRIGYAHDNLLFFATGGLAVVRIEYCAADIACVSDGDEDIAFGKTYVGPTVGGGIEARFGKNWSLKGEYLYIDAGRDTKVYDVSPLQTATFRSSAHIVRIGVNYNF
ncbi:MAG: porin family protein [Gammaproteobacteria bacterium]|nr:porin family protein [Gammaproteobacteria bacterium]